MEERVVSITLPRRKRFTRVLQFMITLIGTDPPIWRRIQVPDYYTLYELHLAIQDAMGWQDCHLHSFEAPRKGQLHGKSRVEAPFAIEDIEDKNPQFTTEVEAAGYFRKIGGRSIYIYDFGDGWEHDVVLEGVFPRVPKEKYPKCIDGRLAGPPEDCGGLAGYVNCLRVLKEQDDSEDILSWLGRWRPDCFRPENVKFLNPRKRLIESLK